MNLGPIATWIVVPAALCAATTVDFQRDVRPIFANQLFPMPWTGHGFAAGWSSSGFPGGRVRRTQDGPAVVPGKPEASRLYQRISEPKPALRMPPPYAHKDLSPAASGDVACVDP